ncbi:Pyridoxal phosphate homeostasis protein [subsurface metagenome]
MKELVRCTNDLPGLDVRGLMTIGSFGVTADETRSEFSLMREMFELFRSDPDIASTMEVLSMGMSGDYTIAIEEGATMVRIGSAIFGPRG